MLTAPGPDKARAQRFAAPAPTGPHARSMTPLLPLLRIFCRASEPAHHRLRPNSSGRARFRRAFAQALPIRLEPVCRAFRRKAYLRNQGGRPISAGWGQK